MNKILISKISGMADPIDQADMLKQITVDRQDRISKFRNADDRKRCYLAGILLQDMCRELGIKNPIFEMGERGKPYIKGHSKIAFNVSHSGEYVVLVFMDDVDAEVGIDIQKKKTLQEKTVHKILCKKEKENVRDLISVWAAKEAFIKWDGRGLSIPLSELEWKEDGSVYFEKENKSAYVQEITIEEEYRCCVCTDLVDVKWEVCFT